MAWKTYYETGSLNAGTLKFNVKRHQPLAAAREAARVVSLRKGLWRCVVLDSRGRETVECVRGRCEKGRGW